MKTYKFPQFKTEIVNPTITVDLNTIGDKAIDKLLSVSFLMEVEGGSKFGATAVDMPYTDTWVDSQVHDMVINWLEQFEI